MADFTFIAVFLYAILGLAQCGKRKHSHDEDEDGGTTGLTVGQTVAITIGGGVALALVIIAIVALLKKCKAKPAVKPEDDKRSSTVVTPIGHTSNPLYDDLPPKYTLREQGPANEVYLPPYPHDTKTELPK